MSLNNSGKKHRARVSIVKQCCCLTIIDYKLFNGWNPGSLFEISLHPCLGDVWAEHVLFEGNQITGLIDFGGMRYDHPAQDLARLLGSYTQGDVLRRQLALTQYAPEQHQELESLTIS